MGMQAAPALSSNELSIAFLAISSLVLAAHLFGHLFRVIRIPKVIGEIVGGIILGPSCLGYFFPGMFNGIFNAFLSEGKLLSLLSWIGMILLMFISGYEAKTALGDNNRKIIIALLLGATLIPFLAGWWISGYFGLNCFLGVKQNVYAFKLVFALAMAVTSIPVISRIFLDLNILDTAFAKIVLSTATIHDVILWIVLAVATGLVSPGGINQMNILSNVAVTLIFFTVALLVIPRIIAFVCDSPLKVLNIFPTEELAFILCFSFVTIASFLNVNIVYGAFLAGITLGTCKGKRVEAVKSKIKDVSIAFFIPVYFALIGLKLDLIHHVNIKLLISFLILATIVQLAGCISALKAVRLNWLSSFNLAVTMNARGGPGIVLATTAYEIGIINESFFTILVLVAIITSIITGYWLKYINSRHYELLS